jgi:dihydropteroate synthase
MTWIAGILNLTPDSFSGDGEFTPEKVINRIDAMIADGASVIDIGAESTRPGATLLSADKEWHRLAPVAGAVASRKNGAHFSIDTRHAEVARKALAAGFDWINDVSSASDPAMLQLAAETGCTLVLMHSLGIPADPKQALAKDVNPVDEVLAWGKLQLARAQQAGIDTARIVLDPGIGFGKSAEHSLALIKGITRLKALGVPVMVGHSRKSFLSLFTDKKSGDRDPETLAVSCYLAEQGVDYLRVHDVKSHAAMLRIRSAL